MSGRSTETLASFVPRVAKKSNSRRNWHGKAAAFNVKKSCQKSVRNFGRRDPLRRRRLGRLRFRLRRLRSSGYTSEFSVSSTAVSQFTTRVGGAIASTTCS